MSLENVQKIVSQAVLDSDFRDLLFSNADKAMAGYDLTEAEIASLRGLSREKFDAAASELEERISRAGFVPGVPGTGGPGSLATNHGFDLGRFGYVSNCN